MRPRFVIALAFAVLGLWVALDRVALGIAFGMLGVSFAVAALVKRE